MNSLDLIKLSRHSEFLNRVQVMTSYVCQQVAKEADTVSGTVQRKKYASMLLNNASGFLNRFALALVSNITIAQNIAINGTTPEELVYSGSITDTALIDGMDIEIQGVIESIFNIFAGVYVTN